MTISTEANPQLPDKVRPYWEENGKALRKFCNFCKEDQRVDVVVLPLFDGVALIKWKMQ
jgi:predicted O-methyltransferase YrrM